MKVMRQRVSERGMIGGGWLSEGDAVRWGEETVSQVRVREARQCAVGRGCACGIERAQTVLTANQAIAMVARESACKHVRACLFVLCECGWAV